MNVLPFEVLRFRWRGVLPFEVRRFTVLQPRTSNVARGTFR
jgi:hypothetical protein